MKFCPTCKADYPDDANFCPQETCATATGPQRLQPKAAEPPARFTPLAKIGGGLTGEVWRARDNQSGNEVAYKIVNADVLPTAAAVARAERELKQLMRVASPKIAAIVDCGKTADDRLFVAMELCAGESLDRVVKTGPLPLGKAKAIVSQVGQALLEAQKAGIVHRDVAPKNVLVAPNGEVKVINFPLAKPVNDKVAGVPGYLSPEQAQGKPVDQRSNTYSLAAIFYHLLTGEAPFQAATPEQIIDLHLSSPALPPSQRRPEASLSPEVDRVILKALDKASSRRHLTLRLFLTEVDALATPVAVGGPLPGGPARENVGFAKTMLFAGGQAEVANLVAKAIAARQAQSPAAARAGVADTVAMVSPVAAAPAVSPAPQAAPGAPAPGAPSSVPAMASVTAPAAVPSPAPQVQAPVAAPRAETVRPQAAPMAAAAPTPAAAAPAPAAAAPGPAGGAPPAAGAAAAAAGGKGPAFRETLWFKKGDVDQMVAEAKAKMAATGRPTGEAEVVDDARPVEDRYVDDGSVTTDDRKKFSLRTGGTATAMPATSTPEQVPGESMSEGEVMGEIAGGRKTTIIVVVALVVAAAIVAAMMLMRGRKEQTSVAPAPPASAATAPVPAPAPAAAPAPPPKPAEPTPEAAPPAPEATKKEVAAAPKKKASAKRKAADKKRKQQR